MKQIGNVGISGQMHSIVFWNENIDCNGFNECSNLITWMDQRCSDEFIDHLPLMSSELVKNMKISTGYGCATIFHYQHHNKEFLSKWKYAGNIVDYAVCQLCKKNNPVMSREMAHSWGYFDIVNKKWFHNVLNDANFPINFLPEVVDTDTVVSQCVSGLYNIPTTANVYVGLADLQCSMFRALSDNSNSAINFSTSSQFAIRLSKENLNQLNNFQQGPIEIPASLVINPFIYDNEYMLVACSLNGGNVLANFVEMLQSWTFQLTGVKLDKENIWRKLVSSSNESESNGSGDHSLFEMPTITPTLFGERFDPDLKASVSNISLNNQHHDVSLVYQELCRGLVKNLLDLLPGELITKCQVNKLTCNGGVIRRHKAVRDSITSSYRKYIPEIVFMDHYDACLGSVEYISSLL